MEKETHSGDKPEEVLDLFAQVYTDLQTEIMQLCAGISATDTRYSNFRNELITKIQNDLLKLKEHPLFTELADEQRSRMYYEMSRILLMISEIHKTQLCEGPYKYLRYEYKKDIAEQHDRYTKELNDKFKTELAAWTYMEIGDWKGALPILRQLAEARKDMNGDYRMEVANWLQRAAANVGDLETFFETLDLHLDPADAVTYNAERAVELLRMLIPGVLGDFAMEPSAAGKNAMSQCQDSKVFMREHKEQLVTFIAARLVEEIFVSNTINNALEFRTFLNDKHIEMFTDYVTVEPLFMNITLKKKE